MPANTWSLHFQFGGGGGTTCQLWNVDAKTNVRTNCFYCWRKTEPWPAWHINLTVLAGLCETWSTFVDVCSMLDVFSWRSLIKCDASPQQKGLCKYIPQQKGSSVCPTNVSQLHLEKLLVMAFSQLHVSQTFGHHFMETSLGQEIVSYTKMSH